MEFIATELPGCYLVRPRVLEDARGFFIKTYHDGNFREAPVRVPFQEEYVTVSRKGVLRGLHFQVPPAALEKIVLCVHGAVLDAVVDLRVGSPTYKKHVLLELQGSGGEMIFVPKGCAHGFYALTDPAILIYKTSHVFRPECDKGIHWASAGIAWPEGSPVISGRDRVLPELAAFQSPFTYAGDS